MAESFSKLSFSEEEVEQFNEYIHIKGARSNNLKNIEVKIPKNKLVVVTGLSGSGKSSLIMDTLYAEGQRRYVESLSSYARQFLDRMKKPDVDFIKGISPAIAIEQKVSGSSNTRSTVGSMTEIYDYLRLLYARGGKTYSPVSGNIVTKHTVTDIVDYILGLEANERVIVLSPLNRQNKDRSVLAHLELLLKKGYSRLYYEDRNVQIEDWIEDSENPILAQTLGTCPNIYVLVDRFSVQKSDEHQKRIADSVLTALTESEGYCRIQIHQGNAKDFSNRFELDGMSFLEPTPQLFNYNNPYGACNVCEGYGKTLGIDRIKVMPDENLSVYDGAIMPWKGELGGQLLKQLLHSAHFFDFPIHTPIKDLTTEQYELLWTGNHYFIGLNDYFGDLEIKKYKIQNRVILARYRGRTVCYACNGGRLRTETRYIKIGGKCISDLIHMPIDELYQFIMGIDFSDYDAALLKRILEELKSRLEVMQRVGLSYLTLDRVASSLSGGESQRIRLTRLLGSNLTNSLYILDEPSVGLHPHDTANLVSVLKNLRDLDNTVVVVEHEEEIIRNADYIIDIGPKAGLFGGELIFSGPFNSWDRKIHESLTIDYLEGLRKIEIHAHNPTTNYRIDIEGARHHNLKNIDVTFPLNQMIVVSGVSGSGKTTLVKHLLYPALKLEKGEALPVTPGKFTSIKGDFDQISKIEFINQKPVGRSSRSNPITYVKAYDAIRALFTKQQLSKIRGFKPKHFSFNVEGGRCETCKGEGEITVEMQFLADVKLTCDDCNGKRFKREVLEVTYNQKSIFDVLEMSVDEALIFFKDQKEIRYKLEPLQQVGLGYVKLGQSSSTLSGGEAQRLKLASYLGKDNKAKSIFFIFDEPTTGLHFHDIQKLLDAFHALIEKGNTVLIVEHNVEIIKSADWLIDLGPEGGKGGGYLVYQGKPKGLLKEKSSLTAPFLKGKL